MEIVATMIGSTAMEVGATETAGSLFAFAESAGSMGSIGSLLMGGFSVMSGISEARAQNAASRMQAYQYENAAKQMELKAQQEETKGLEEANIIKQRTLRVLAANTAAAGARGIDINAGSASQIQDEVWRQSSKQLAINRTDTEIASLADEISAYNYKADAAYTLDMGSTNARATLFETAARTLSRGSSIQLNP